MCLSASENSQIFEVMVNRVSKFTFRRILQGNIYLCDAEVETQSTQRLPDMNKDISVTSTSHKNL